MLSLGVTRHDKTSQDFVRAMPDEAAPISLIEIGDKILRGSSHARSSSSPLSNTALTIKFIPLFALD
jgi:hypothetical protein